MRMNEIKSINKLNSNKAIIYIPEYKNINTEIFNNYLIKTGNELIRNYNINKFYLFGYFHQQDIQEFLIGDRNINININIKINKEFEENTKENIFEFIVFDYFQSSNIQKIFGNSEFLFILNEENKIIFTTKSYRLKNFMYSMKISFYALIFYFIIIMPSIENLIIISD